MVILPGMHGTRVWLEERLVGRVRLALIFIWCVPYLVYAAGTHNWRWTALIRILIVSAFSPLIYRFCPFSDPPRFCWQDFLVAVCLTAVLLSHQLAGIWNSPVNLDFMGRLFLIGISSWSWVFIRRVPELGYEFSISSKTIRAAALNFALFAVIAIPSSLALRFTQWNPLPHQLPNILSELLGDLFVHCVVGGTILPRFFANTDLPQFRLGARRAFACLLPLWLVPRSAPSFPKLALCFVGHGRRLVLWLGVLEGQKLDGIVTHSRHG